MQQHSGKMFHMSFMCKSLSAYGSLPLQLQREEKMGSFVKKLKNFSYHTIRHYGTTCYHVKTIGSALLYSINIYIIC